MLPSSITMGQKAPVISQKTAPIIPVSGRPPANMPLLFRYAFIAVTVAFVVWLWRSRQGAFRAATQRGGWRIAIAVASSIGILALGIGIAIAS